jgi:glutamate-1-semialdehyde 2,1-aminomutase
VTRGDATVQRLSDLKAVYVARSPKSAALYDLACSYLPGGNARVSLYISPHPIYLERGEGAYVWDIDGNKRLDLNYNQFVVVLGHAHPAVVKAISEQAAKGVCFGASTETEVKLAQMICQRAPSIDKIRFANTGSEATMQAIRIARAYTGKEKFAKFEGGYHGVHDQVEVSIHPPLDGRAGSPDEPKAWIDEAGVTQSAGREVIVLPFNNASACERIIMQNRTELAAVIAEPIMGVSGMVMPDPGFLASLRRITEEAGVLLIFDEVVTFRVAPGGAQEIFGVYADLTCIGKIIGGGLPIGAFGGKARIMEITDPTSDRLKVKPAGTFTANPLSMVAGIAALEQLTPDVYSRMNGLGNGLRSGLHEVFSRWNIPAQVVGIGSVFCIHFTPTEIHNHRDTRTVDSERTQRFFWHLTNNGVLVNKSLRCALSSAIEQRDLDTLLAVVEDFARNEGAMT